MNPWMILALLVALGLAYFTGRIQGASAEAERGELAAAKVTHDRDEADRKARADYTAKLEAQDAAIRTLRADAATAAAQYAKDLAAARATSATVTKEVVRYVTANPSPDACRMPARLFELRREQIRAANATGGQSASVAASGLRRGVEGHPAANSRADLGRSERDRAGRRLDHRGLWRSAAASDRARRMC